LISRQCNHLFCGKGNNSGDGLVIARLLSLNNIKVTVFIPSHISSASLDFLINLKRLEAYSAVNIRNFEDDFKETENTICIDAIFGSGIKSPLDEYYIGLINRINNDYQNIMSIDIDSGLPRDWNDAEEIVAIQSSITYCIHSRNASLFIAETGHYCQKIKVVAIGLNISDYNEIESDIFYTTSEVLSLLPARPKFSYKQKLGHVLVAEGNKGMAGVAYLCGKASIEVRAGMVNYNCPEASIVPLQASFLDAMKLLGVGQDYLEEKPKSLTNYSVLAIGPGIGTHLVTQKMLQERRKPVVIDADALNCIAGFKYFDWPVNAIITPHTVEFERLTKIHKSSYERFVSPKEFSIKHQIIVVLKGAYTCISLPNGPAHINSSGTQALAKAGSGDLLKGIIAGYLAQGLQPEAAAVLGVYVHRKSGEIAASKKGIYSTNATNIINNIHLCINLKK